MKAQRGAGAAKAMQKKPDEDAAPSVETLDDARERAEEAARAATDVEAPASARTLAGEALEAEVDRALEVASAPSAGPPSAVTSDGETMPRAPAESPPAPPAVASVPNGAQLGAVALGAVACLPLADARSAYLAGFARIAVLELELRTTTARIEYAIRAERDALKPAEHSLCEAMRAEKRLVELPGADGKPVTYKTRARPGIEPKPGTTWLMLQVVKA